MPCCFDALSASMIEQAGFDLTFMHERLRSFRYSTCGAGTGLISYGEMLDQGRSNCGGKVKQAALSYHR
jgi:hypothetical protein